MPLAGEALLFLDVEALDEALQRLVELRHNLIPERARLADRRVDRAVGAQRLAQLLLEARHLADGDLVEIAVVAGVDRDDLLLERPRLVLGLVQRRDHSLAAPERLLRRRVE